MPRRWPRLRIRVRSRIWQQLTAIVLACALPLTIATALLAVENNRRIAYTRTELRGLAYLAPLTGLLADVSLHRSLHRQGQAGGRPPARPPPAPPPRAPRVPRPPGYPGWAWTWRRRPRPARSASTTGSRRGRYSPC